MILFLYTGVKLFLTKKREKSKYSFPYYEKRKELSLYCAQCNI